MASTPALDLRWGSGPDVATLIDLLYAALDEPAFEPLAIHDHETADGWRVFFRTPVQRNAAAAALRTAFGARVSVDAYIEVADEDWARRSQANLTAIRVGRIIVAPPWDVPETTDPVRAVIIEPSTGFGTGHHETTRLCLGLMQEVALGGQRAIDVGTGSGVLAIAASKLGASVVVAFDEDPQALRNARENVDRNLVSSTVVVRELDLGSPAFDLPPAALVMANLTSGVLVKYADRLADLVEPGGHLLISGFAPDDLPDLIAAFGADDVRPAVEGAWAAALLRFTDSPASS